MGKMAEMVGMVSLDWPDIQVQRVQKDLLGPKVKEELPDLAAPRMLDGVAVCVPTELKESIVELPVVASITLEEEQIRRSACQMTQSTSLGIR